MIEEENQQSHPVNNYMKKDIPILLFFTKHLKKEMVEYLQTQFTV